MHVFMNLKHTEFKPLYEVYSETKLGLFLLWEISAKDQ